MEIEVTNGIQEAPSRDGVHKSYELDGTQEIRITGSREELSPVIESVLLSCIGRDNCENCECGCNESTARTAPVETAEAFERRAIRVVRDAKRKGKL